MLTISATDLARRTREILDTVVHRGQSVAVERNHIVIAQIVPPEPTLNAAEALAGFEPMLTSRQAATWLKDSRADFEETVRDPWA